MMLYYAGIGSQETPIEVQNKMIRIARFLAKREYILRSGGAEGADSAFEIGSKVDNHKNGLCQIFLPWAGFNNRPRYYPYIYPPTLEAMNLAARFHPAWKRCSHATRLLHARNFHEVLGPNLDEPVNFIVCWYPGYGGTMQAVRIANYHKIPVYNLHDIKILRNISSILQEWIDKRNDKSCEG